MHNGGTGDTPQRFQDEKQSSDTNEAKRDKEE